MLMKDQKRNLASIIVAKMTKPSPESSESENMEPEYDELQAAADEVMAAIDTKDAVQLKDALKAMIQMCMNKAEAEEEASESQEIED